MGLESKQALLDFGQRGEIVGGEDLFFEQWRNRFSTWLSQMAWIGVWMKMALDHWARKRCAAF
jgi:hypothetical protein